MSRSAGRGRRSGSAWLTALRYVLFAVLSIGLPTALVMVGAVYFRRRVRSPVSAAQVQDGNRDQAGSIPSGVPNWLIVHWGVPIALGLLAGRRFFPLWAVVRHRGRRSGRALSVPVAVQVRGDVFVVPLLFGPRTNWVMNVLAAGGCVIRWRGVDHRAVGPVLIDPEQARAYFGRFGWFASERLVGPEGFLLLRHVRVIGTGVGHHHGAVGNVTRQGRPRRVHRLV